MDNRHGRRPSHCGKYGHNRQGANCANPTHRESATHRVARKESVKFACSEHHHLRQTFKNSYSSFEPLAICVFLYRGRREVPLVFACVSGILTPMKDTGNAEDVGGSGLSV